MSLFDDILDARSEAVAAEGEHKTRVPSFPPQVRAVWKPLDDPSALTVLIAQAKGDADDEAGRKLARLLAKSLVRFEATDGDPDDPAAEWVVVEDDEGPLLFDQRMERRLKAKGMEVEPGTYGTARAVCGGAAGLLELASEVGNWQLFAAKRIEEKTQGTMATQRKTPATAPLSE